MQTKNNKNKAILIALVSVAALSGCLAEKDKKSSSSSRQYLYHEIPKENVITKAQKLGDKVVGFVEKHPAISMVGGFGASMVVGCTMNEVFGLMFGKKEEEDNKGEKKGFTDSEEKKRLSQIKGLKTFATDGLTDEKKLEFQKFGLSATHLDGITDSDKQKAKVEELLAQLAHRTLILEQYDFLESPYDSYNMHDRELANSLEAKKANIEVTAYQWYLNNIDYVKRFFDGIPVVTDTDTIEEKQKAEKMAKMAFAIHIHENGGGNKTTSHAFPQRMVNCMGKLGFDSLQNAVKSWSDGLMNVLKNPLQMFQGNKGSKKPETKTE